MQLDREESCTACMLQEAYYQGVAQQFQHSCFQQSCNCSDLDDAAAMRGAVCTVHRQQPKAQLISAHPAHPAAASGAACRTIHRPLLIDASWVYTLPWATQHSAPTLKGYAQLPAFAKAGSRQGSSAALATQQL
jgi:hypothetical protein